MSRLGLSFQFDAHKAQFDAAHSRQQRCQTSEDRGQKGDQPRLNSPLNFRRDFITDFPPFDDFQGLTSCLKNGVHSTGTLRVKLYRCDFSLSPLSP